MTKEHHPLSKTILKTAKIAGGVYLGHLVMKNGGSDALNIYLQKCIQERNDKKIQQEKNNDRIKSMSPSERLQDIPLIVWIKIVIGVAVAIFVIVNIIIVMEPPVPKQKVPNPLAPLEKKISKGIEQTYDFITEDK